MARSSGAFRVGAAASAWWLATVIALGVPPEPVSKLSEKLASSEKEIRREAAFQLDRLGLEGREALPALIKGLSDSDKQVWSSCVSAIAKIGPAATDAIPALLGDLDSRKARGGREREKRQALVRSAHALSCIGAAAIHKIRKIFLF